MREEQARLKAEAGKAKSELKEQAAEQHLRFPLNPEPGTRNTKHETRSPEPPTRKPKPETRKPKPEARNPNTETLDRTPETLSQEDGIYAAAAPGEAGQRGGARAGERPQPGTTYMALKTFVLKINQAKATIGLFVLSSKFGSCSRRIRAEEEPCPLPKH